MKTYRDFREWLTQQFFNLFYSRTERDRLEATIRVGMRHELEVDLMVQEWEAKRS